MKYVLAIDIGASSGRHILGCVKNDTIEIKEVHRFENTAVKKHGHLVWPVDFLFDEIKKGIKKCHDMSIYPESCALDTWGVDYVLLDENDHLLGDAISYRDTRTENMMETVFETVSKDEIYQKTGIQFMHINSLFQLAAQKKEDAQLLARAQTFLTMPDYLGFLLSGAKYNEYTEASTTQILNAQTRTWDIELLKALGINHDMFCDIVYPGTIVGTVKDDIAPNGMKLIAVGSHDTASAVAAVPTENNDFMYISSGTWALMGVEETQPSLNENTQKANFTNEGGVYGTIRLLKNITGMWIIQQVRVAQDKRHSFAAYVVLAEKEKPYASLIDPNDNRFHSPDNMVYEIQNFCEQTQQKVPQSDGEIARCVFDSMALVYKKTLNDLERICDKQFNDIHIIGGGCQNLLVNQLTANVTGRKVIAGPIEATAIGNIMLQLITLGALKDIDSARRMIAQSFKSVEYCPIDEDVDIAEVYERFLKLL